MTCDDPPIVHVWQRCHGCGAAPITGRRYDCHTCPAGPDNHLCETCYTAFRRGALRHPAADSYAGRRDVTGDAVHDFREGRGMRKATAESWLKVPDGKGTAPPVANRLLLRPEFCTRHGSFLAGYAFGLALSDRVPPLVVTGLHVLDEVIKAAQIDCSSANTAYTGRELPAVVERVHLYDLLAENWMRAPIGDAAPMVVLPDARVGDEEPYSQRDIAAFAATSSLSFAPAPLAASLPEVGKPIWLAVRLAAAGSTRTVAATVIEHTAETFIFRYTTEPPRAASGAPLLNSRGEVVGINLGSGTLDGRLYGHANHADSIRRHLAGAPAIL